MDKKLILKLDLELYEEIVKLADINHRDVTKQIRALLISGMNNYYTNAKLDEIMTIIKDTRNINIQTREIDKFIQDLLIQIYCDMDFQNLGTKNCYAYQQFLKNRKKDRFND